MNHKPLVSIMTSFAVVALLLVGVLAFQVSGEPSSPDVEDSHWIRSIPVTRWVSPGEERPLSYRQWKAEHPDVPFVRGKPMKGTLDDSTKVLVLVNHDLYDTLSVSLAQYVADLELEGYTVEVMSVAGGTPADLKSLLQARPELLGAVLVGDLPVPWFQMIDDFEGDGVPDGYEEFPIDLYYMDLDGEWLDLYTYDPAEMTFVPGADGILETHVENVSPEIWVGRLTASPLYQSEIFLLENYFSKAHRYREGSLWVLDRALNYIDDDWSGLWTTAGLDSIYEEVVVVDHPETTVASDYAEELVTNYEWIGVCAHSWPEGHGFKYNQGLYWSWFYNYQLNLIDPQAFFYNLFACSNARYVESSYMGGCYIFTDSYGLGAVGSTKTGSMLQFEVFYYPLGAGACLGQAFQEWFSAMAEGGFQDWERSWFYGMTLLGDPTLAPRQPDRTSPRAVADLRAILAGQATYLEWSPVTEDVYGQAESVAYYVIYRDTSSSFQPVPEDSIGWTAGQSYLDPWGASQGAGSSRYYLLVAVDEADNRSVPSNEVGQFDRALLGGRVEERPFWRRNLELDR